CRVPGCTATHVEIHHIVHWRDGGPTDPENLVSLCARHHRLHHQGEVRITGTASDLNITDRTGQPLKTGPNPVLPTGPPGEPAVPYRHPSGERLDTRWFTGWTHPVVRERHEATLAKHRAAMARQYQAA
ncbi:MAG TPA: HNH endonuclease signature motif containing protein, partial [Ilumatobacter sp.]|nr:HNH endonuclease signature motif containing protein [Ilumatobacter sp.]